MRVALDTNVLVAAVATRGLCADLLHVILAEHQLILGETVRGELRRVLRAKLGLGAEVIDEYESFLERQSILVAATEPLAFPLRDPTDAQVLAEAVAGQADALVTGDRDLLSVAAKAPLLIVDPRGFWELLRRGA